MGMVKGWLTIVVVGWLVAVGAVTGFGGWVTGDWEYAFGTGLKRLAFMVAMSLIFALPVSALSFLVMRLRGRRGLGEPVRLTALMSLAPALLVGVGTLFQHFDGLDVWSMLPGGPSWLVSSLERRNPDLDVEDIGAGGIAIYRADGQRVTLWPWQLKNAKIDWKKCEAADVELLGPARPDPAASCVHRIRVEAPAESFTLLALSIGEADPQAAATALQEQYERAGGIYKDHLVVEQGGVRRRIEGRGTRRWGNWVYVGVIDAETASRSGG